MCGILYYSVIRALHFIIIYDFHVYDDFLSLLVNNEPKSSHVVKAEPLSECEEDPEVTGVKRPRIGGSEDFNKYIAYWLSKGTS